MAKTTKAQGNKPLTMLRLGGDLEELCKGLAAPGDMGAIPFRYSDLSDHPTVAKPGFNGCCQTRESRSVRQVDFHTEGVDEKTASGSLQERLFRRPVSEEGCCGLSWRALENGSPLRGCKDKLADTLHLDVVSFHLHIDAKLKPIGQPDKHNVA